MFIHQTGRKYKKLTPSLEDVKEAYMLISSTEPDYQTPDEDKINKINIQLQVWKEPLFRIKRSLAHYLANHFFESALFIIFNFSY
jgi:hypothetical protein